MMIYISASVGSDECTRNFRVFQPGSLSIMWMLKFVPVDLISTSLHTVSGFRRNLSVYVTGSIVEDSSIRTLR